MVVAECFFSFFFIFSFLTWSDGFGRFLVVADDFFFFIFDVLVDFWPFHGSSGQESQPSPGEFPPTNRPFT